MFEKIYNKVNLVRLVALLLIVSVFILTLSILTDSKDGRRQIIDKDGSSEEQLCTVLSSISGAGDVDVMIQCNSEEEVTGVIVIADGGSNPIIANNLTKAVATLYNIPVSNVIVFEKEQED